MIIIYWNVLIKITTCILRSRFFPVIKGYYFAHDRERVSSKVHNFCSKTLDPQPLVPLNERLGPILAAITESRGAISSPTTSNELDFFLPMTTAAYFIAIRLGISFMYNVVDAAWNYKNNGPKFIIDGALYYQLRYLRVGIT